MRLKKIFIIFFGSPPEKYSLRAHNPTTERLGDYLYYPKNLEDLLSKNTFV